MRAAKPFCGMEQMAPHVNPGGRDNPQVWLRPTIQSHDNNNDERMNSCPVRYAWQDTLVGTMSSIVTGASMPPGDGLVTKWHGADHPTCANQLKSKPVITTRMCVTVWYIRLMHTVVTVSL